MSLAYVSVNASGSILQNEDEIATLRIAGFRPDPDIQVNPNFSFNVALDEALGHVRPTTPLGKG